MSLFFCKKLLKNEGLLAANEKFYFSLIFMCCTTIYVMYVFIRFMVSINDFPLFLIKKHGHVIFISMLSFRKLIVYHMCNLIG